MASTKGFTSTQDTELFRQLDTYPWASDKEFQNGLRAILGPNPRPEQAEQLTLRARCFYYARKHDMTIDFDAYKEWHARQGSTTQMKLSDAVIQSTAPREEQLSSSSDLNNSEKLNIESADHPAPYPLSFNHIVDLITSGQPVPGVKEIPDTVLDGQASQGVRPKRRKPWETASSDEVDSQVAPFGKTAEESH
ncbi:hypothetical protein MMC18_004332 [Xylographa bjoerkii]|nr:hypothetical protein [Xylographa bjoerkii]